MVEHGKIFKCEDCGSIVEVLVDAHEEKDCCDSSKNVIEPQTEGDKAPKHVPVISVDGNEVTVAVGEVQHPMDDDHFIQFVELIVGDERYIKHFKPEHQRYQIINNKTPPNALQSPILGV